MKCFHISYFPLSLSSERSACRADIEADGRKNVPNDTYKIVDWPFKKYSINSTASLYDGEVPVMVGGEKTKRHDLWKHFIYYDD
jgi:hypothetical protein